MIENRICERCGSSLELASSGGDVLCARCLARSLAPDQLDDMAFDPPAGTVPRLFGAYELLEEIGRGGMGVVYRARQLALDRSVAVKLLLAGAYSSEATLRRFRLEAAAAASLQHPNIVPIHDYGECDGQPFYAMDLIAGRDLAAVCGGRPLVARRAAELLQTLARAVQHAHDAGIAHRDLKPSNVLIDADDRPHITDFGLAKRLDRAEGVTVTGQMVGSPSYAAPEQALGHDDQVGVRSDVYGLGALLYHLVTGRAPFNAATPTETLRLVLETDPPPPRLLNPSLPRDLATICLTCLAKEPARRYATAAEVAADLDRFLSERPICARPPSVLYRARKFWRRHFVVAVATAAVVTALLVGLLVSLAGYHRAVAEQRATEAARGQAERLLGLMTSEVNPLLEQRGGLAQLRKTTEAAILYFESLPAELRNPRTDSAHADALVALARLLGRSLNDEAGAAAALDAALALRQRVAEANPHDPDAAVAWLLDEWERPRTMGAVGAYHDYDRQRQFLGRWQELHARFPGNLRVKRGLAEASSLCGDMATTSDRPEEALPVALQGRALVEELVAAAPDDDSLGELVFVSLRALSNAYANNRDLAKGMAVGQQAVDFCNAALEKDPANLTLRCRAAEAARSLSYKAFTVSPRQGCDVERTARAHFRLLVQANPEDQDLKARYVLTHRMEAIYLSNGDGHRATARAALDNFDRLLAALPERNEEFDPAEQRTMVSVLRAQLAARAGEVATARPESREVLARVDIQVGRLPAGSPERHVVRARFLQELLWVEVNLRDGPALARGVEKTTAVIETGLRALPGNIELQQRRAQMECFRGIALQQLGRAAEAAAVLEDGIACVRSAPRAFLVFDVNSLMGAASFARAKALAQTGDGMNARVLAEALLTAPNPELPESWCAKEWQARVSVLVAGLLGPDEATRRSELLDRAHEILTRPEADGRITTTGRETLVTIAALRNEE